MNALIHCYATKGNADTKLTSDSTTLWQWFPGVANDMIHLRNVYCQVYLYHTSQVSAIHVQH